MLVFSALLALLSVQAKATDIALLHHAPESAPAGKPLAIAGQMVGSSEVEHCEIRYRMRGTAEYQLVELELVQGDDYAGAIPAAAVIEGVLEYYVLAFDFLGKSREVFASARRPQRVLIEPAVAGATGDSGAPGPSASSGPTGVTTAPVNAATDVSPTSPAAPREDLHPTEIVRTFSSDELLALGALTVADAIERMFDLAVTRGSDGKYLVARAGMANLASFAVILDGQPLHTAAAGAPDLRMSLALIERLEIVITRGRATDLWHGPIGTVLLTSKRATFTGRAQGGGYLSHTTAPGAGTVGTYDGALQGGGSVGVLTLHGRGAVHYSNGAQLLVERDVLARSVSLTPGITNDRALRLQLGATLEAKLPERHTLRFDADFFRFDHGGYIGAADVFGPDSRRATNTARAALQLTSDKQQAVRYAARLGYRLLLQDDTLQLAPAGYQAATLNGTTETFADGVSERIGLNEHVIDARAEVDASVGKSQVLSAAVGFEQHLITSATLARTPESVGPATSLTAAVPGARSAVAVAIADKVTPAEWAALDFGVRFSMASDLGLLSGDVANVVTPVLQATFFPYRAASGGGLDITLRYDTISRAPTLLERAMPIAFEGRGPTGNPALRYSAARTARLDIGYSGVAAGVRYRAELSGYYVGERAGIVSANLDGTGERFLGSQTVDAAGATFATRVDFATRSYIRFGTTWHRAFAVVDASQATTLLTDTPQLIASLAATLELGTLADLTVSGTYQAERRNSVRTNSERNHAFRIPAQMVVFAQLRTRPWSGLRLFINGSNVFDAARFDPPTSGAALPGLVPREGFRLLAGFEFSLDDLPQAKRASEKPAGGTR